jgi:hypothetical protein
MSRFISSCLAAPALAALLATAYAVPVMAEESSTDTADFCGAPTGKALDLIQRYTTDPALKRVYKSTNYIAYSDDEKQSTVMYTFTTKDNPAYPAAVCRKPERVGGNLVIKMSIVCDGKPEACTDLKNQFNVMTARMQTEVNQKIGHEND